MHMTATEDRGCLVISVGDDRIDAAVAVRFRDLMRELTDQRATRIILDLQDVEFVDSSGLGAVVGSMKQLGGGRRMDLAGLSPGVEKVFRMTRMDTVFRIFPDVGAALAGVADAT